MNKMRFTGMLSQNKKGQIWVQDPVSGNYHELNDVGGTICRLLKKGMDIEMLLQALMDEYDVGRAQCEEEVLRFLEQLRVNGLLKEEQA